MIEQLKELLLQTTRIETNPRYEREISVIRSELHTLMLKAGVTDVEIKVIDAKINRLFNS